MSKHNKMGRLHIAALQLITDIDDTILEDAPEGVFRLPSSASTINEYIEQIQNDQFNNFDTLDQYGRSSLLKAIFRKMKEEGDALFSAHQLQILISAKKQMEMDLASEDAAVANMAQENHQKSMYAVLKGASYMHQKIAYNFLNMLNKVATKHELTKMAASNLAAVTGASLFAIPQDSDEAIIHEVHHFTEQLIEGAAKLSKPEKILGGTHYKHQNNGAAAKDHAISQILLDFKQELEKARSTEHLDSIVGVLKKSPEYQDLKTGQGLMGKIFGLKMPSIKAFEDMIGEQKNNFMIEKEHRDLNAI